MFDKPIKPVSLQILEVLRKRKPLSREQQSSYHRLASGFEGEVKFAKLLKEKFRNDCIQLFSLNLKVNGSECQLDNILIFQNVIFLLDIKNFQGDYLIENNQWYSVTTRAERKNPLHQLKRANIIFQDFLSTHYFQSTVDSSLVFVNEGFHLYQSSFDLPIIFPSQLHRFIQKLNNIPSRLDTGHEMLAKKLTTAHLPRSKHEDLPVYEYNQLKRGIVCLHCDGFTALQHSRKLICRQCGMGEQVDNAVVRTVKEFHFLFPNEKISVHSIYHWCNGLIPMSGIRRILSIYFKLKHGGRSSHYIFK